MEKNFQSFTELVKENEELREKLQRAADPNELVSIASEFGFDLAPEDFTGEHPGAPELSDQELETVSGGFGIVATIAGRELTWWLCDLKRVDVKGPGGLGGGVEFK
jgi:predicted ribosomally synthesized peptide with nif11-like leader